MLARPKKGKSSQERLAEIYTGELFAKLTANDPLYMNRVTVVEGNLHELDIGISAEDRSLIVQNVQIVVHSGADVRFDETLQNLLLVNLRGTREVMRLAEQIVNLEVCMHISTAYSHCPRKHIGECFYPSPMDPNRMIQLAESMEGLNKVVFETLTEKMIRPWPNTYTFTKALSEELVRGFGQRIPVAIIRPSIGLSCLINLILVYKSYSFR